MMPKPKLLFFITTLNFGGAERVVSQLLNHLQDSYELHLALYSNIIKYKIPDTVKILNLYEEVNAGNAKLFLRLPFIAKKLAGYCKIQDINVCVSFLNRPSYVNAIMKSVWGFKGKSIMCERSHQSNILNYIGSSVYKRITKFMVNYSYQKADLVITNSEVSKADLIENFAITKPIAVIYNPIDIKATQKQAEQVVEIGDNDNSFYFVTAGNFRTEKNFSLLLSAFSLLKKLPVKLLMVGGGALENELKEQTEKLGIGDRVIFTGFQSNPYKYINAANCFVLSSFVEGFPNVLLEALACGKPIISTDCLSGPRELLAPDTNINQQVSKQVEIAKYGLLTKVNDVNQLAQAMEQIFTNTTLQKEYINKSRSRAQEFDVNEIKKLFISAFSE